MSDAVALSRVLRECAGRHTWEPSAALDDVLARLLSDGRAARPGVEVPAEDFVRHLARRLPPVPDEEALSCHLAKLHAGDVYLACACAVGDPAALRAFESAYLAHVPSMLTRLRAPEAFVDEVRQLVRERLFVRADEEPPKIASYTGDGPLLHWLRAVVLRIALNLRRSQGDADRLADAALLTGLAAMGHVEMDYIKGRHGKDVLSALAEGVARLPAEQRNVLRLHYAAGLSGDRIAALLGKGRATVVRWLAAARSALLLHVRQVLTERLGLSPAEADSLIELVRSQLDLSLSVILQDDPA